MTEAAASPGPPGGGSALLRPAIGYALAAADAITPGMLRWPTPCRGWDLLMLLRHVNESTAGHTRTRPRTRRSLRRLRPL